MAGQLKDVYGKGADHPEIKIYYNTHGLRKICEDALECKEKIARYFLSDFNLEELIDESFVDDFVKKRIEKGIKSLALRSFNYKPLREAAIPKKEQLREVKYMPEKLFIKPYICIYDNRVAMISSKEGKFGFIIESQEFAEAQKQIFNILWNNIAI